MAQPNTIQEILFYALFGSTATIALIAGLYLLLRRSNAIAPEINSPLRLRRWAAAFFFGSVISHLCWLLFRYEPSADIFNSTLLCIAIDAVTTLPTLLCTMLVMLQDRKRPLWPVAIVEALTLAGVLLIYLDGGLLFVVIMMYIFIFICVIFSLVIAVREYGCWLRENFSDMEDKKVWKMFLVVGGFMLITVAYSLANEFAFFEIFIEVVDIAFFATLLWRVETLENLEECAVDAPVDTTDGPDPITESISSLLQQHCVEGQFYLRHDASLSQLAQLIDFDIHFLSHYFTIQGHTYYSYINSLRIAHFERLYEEARSSQSDVNVDELYLQCGFGSYSAFTRAFKKIKLMTLAEWLSEEEIEGDRGR